MSVRWGSGGPFGVVPGWVIEARLSDRAVRLYAVLAQLAGSPEATTFRGKGELADRLDCARSTIERATAELVKIGAVSIVKQTTTTGGQDVNGYVVHAVPAATPGEVPPDPSGGGPPDSWGGLNKGVRAEEANADQLHPQPPADQAAAPPGRQVIVASRSMRVDRVTVTDRELALAIDVLHAFNETFGTRYAAEEWLRKIVMRIREHPDLTLDEHRAAMQVAAEDQWWQGSPSPAVVYGNAALFEKVLHTAPGGRRKRGMTPDEIAAFDLDEPS